jgi:radical SAM family uncharacterized protein
MSSIAIPILYEILNNQNDVLAERVFCPWPDMAEALRSANWPLVSLESHKPIANFDILGFSLGYELGATNILEMLDLSRIPLLAKQRDNRHPLVIGGGSASLNPEPLTDFFDLFVIGDGEETILELIEVYRRWKAEKNKNQQELLLSLAKIQGIYVPMFYNIEYDNNKITKRVTAIQDAPNPIRRRIIDRLPPPPKKPVVPFIETVQDRGVVEIARGCTRGCRFCNAGMVYRPRRQRGTQEVIRSVEEIIDNTGYEEISLLSLSTSDYDSIGKLVESLSHSFTDKHLSISLPSLRVGHNSVQIVNTLSSNRRTGLTFAPEVGSTRLQKVINKVIPIESLVETAKAAFSSGWTHLKLYFMLGLPTETLEDVEAIANMINEVYSAGRTVSKRLPKLRVSLSTFIPKAHTPFQWVGQEKEEILLWKLGILRGLIRKREIKLSWNDPKMSLIESMLSRGDRQLGHVIHRVWQLGGRFDAWDEHFHFGLWQRALTENNLSAEFYANRERSSGEFLPWSHIDIGVSKQFLRREYQRAIKGRVTDDCHYKACSSCGLEKTESICFKRSMK